MSRRKSRQAQRLAPEAAAMAAVRELLPQPNVLAIDGELQSAYAVLAIFVRLADAATEDEVARLDAAIAARLAQSLPQGEGRLRWDVSYWKGEELVDCLEQRDLHQLSEAALAEDWLRPEEDEAWAPFQPPKP